MRQAPVMISPLRAIAPARLARLRVILTDIDGTITRDGKITAEMIAGSSQLAAAGVEILPVTGRSAGEALGLARYIPAFRRAIAENGGVLVVPDQPLYFLRPPVDRDRLAAAAAELGHGQWMPAPCSAFRLTDQAWERADQPSEKLADARVRAEAMGLHLTWSSVHIHLTELPPDKGAGALRVLGNNLIDPQDALAIGDAPNDEGLWERERFGVTVGTAEVVQCWSQLRHRPEFVVGSAATGWLEMAAQVRAAKG